MIVHEYKTVRYGSNEATPFHLIQIGPGEHRVNITYEEGTTATVTPKQFTDPQNPDSSSPVTVDGVELVLTSSGGFIVMGPCFIGCIVADLAGAVVLYSP